MPKNGKTKHVVVYGNLCEIQQRDDKRYIVLHAGMEIAEIVMDGRWCIKFKEGIMLTEMAISHIWVKFYSMVSKVVSAKRKGLRILESVMSEIGKDECEIRQYVEHRMCNGKLRTLDDLAADMQLRRDRGETVAFTNGCFDILHAGHVDYLRRCRQEASLLVVGVNTDASVRTLNKGDDRPINRFEDRAAVIGAMECVDYVVGFDQPDLEALIQRVRPDVLLKGEDWADKGAVGASFVESIGGRVVLVPLVEGLSTTAILERIRAQEKEEAQTESDTCPCCHMSDLTIDDVLHVMRLNGVRRLQFSKDASADPSSKAGSALVVMWDGTAKEIRLQKRGDR